MKAITGRNILLGITGSIAAYKSAEIARQFIKNGFNVRVMMTHSAKEFITPLTLQALTNNPVTSDFWKEGEKGIDHIELSDWADVVLIAPATADFIAKLNYGFAESVPLAVCLATKARVIIAPAMNVNMLENEQTQKNLKDLKSKKIQIINPESGDLACGWNGSGRLADPVSIFKIISELFTRRDLEGKHIIVTAGGTREAIDPVRYISNRSSGKMGISIARAAAERGANVTLVHAAVDSSLLRDLPSSISRIETVDAASMEVALKNALKSKTDYLVMAAAVADFSPAKVSGTKIKKSSTPDSIALKKNNDILKVLTGMKLKSAPKFVAFAVETGSISDLKKELGRKLKDKKADLIVGNLAADSFEKDTNKIVILNKKNKFLEIAQKEKTKLAGIILDHIKEL